MNNWEKELKLIESLGKLYPKIYISYSHFIELKDYQENNSSKAWWVCCLCRYHLKRRLPRLEEFIKENNIPMWERYVDYFYMKDRGGIFGE